MSDEQMRRAAEVINGLSVQPDPRLDMGKWINRIADVVERGNNEDLNELRTKMIAELSPDDIVDIAIGISLLQWIAAQDEWIAAQDEDG